MPRPSDLPRVAVLGQGSIGRRHAGILRDLGCDVVVFDPAETAEPLQGATVAGSEAEAVKSSDAVIVASPTSHHAEQVCRVLDAGRPALVEKPLALTAGEAARVAAQADEAGVLLAVAMNLRFHPGPSTVSDLVASGTIGQPLLADVHFGSYLPDWRPSADYRRSYSARAELGGGVLLDVIHEIDYLVWALGPAAEVSATVKRVSELELDVEDVALLHLTLASGAVASLSLDYLDRFYRRGCRVVGSEASVEWDFTAEEVRLLGPGNRVETRAAPADVQPSYRAELERFMAAVTGGDTHGLVTPAEGVAALEVVDAARDSAETGRRVALQA